MPIRKRAIALVAILFATVSGCAIADRSESRSAWENAPVKPSIPMSSLSAEREFLSDDELDWGLALSGGGLRSALFSFGVLKALYDAERLDDIDIISTVSGGGYTAYWMYANALKHESGSLDFGDYSLSNDEFPKRLCQIMNTANFVPYWRTASVLRGTPFSLAQVQSRSVRLYEGRLLRTFGTADSEQDPIRLADIRTPVLEGDARYLILNATIRNDDEEAEWPNKLMEFTPIQYGASDYDYVQWRGTDENRDGPESLSLRTAVASSGAAVSILDQKIELMIPGSADSMRLSDGGKSENLGAMALIRRNIPNIIVSDAEHDPLYMFNAYVRLKWNLAYHYGYDLAIEEIDDYLGISDIRTFDSVDAYMESRSDIEFRPFPHLVSTGVVSDSNGNVVSNIYYVKANVSRSMRLLLDQQRSKGSEGEGYELRFDSEIERASETVKGDECEAVQNTSLPLDESPLVMTNWAAYNTGRYEHFLNNENLFIRLVNNVARFTGLNFLIARFPQYSTGDQSFYRDQARAFIGLGYLEGSCLGATKLAYCGIE